MIMAPIMSYNETTMKRTQAFTLIELLITIGIIGILAAAAILVLNPVELLNRARDSRRTQELQSIHEALNIYEVGEGTSYGAANTVYISIPDTSATCANLTLPSLPGPGWSYACTEETNLRRVDSNGWIPVDFTSIAGGSPLSKLPIDPINSDTDNLYYAYVTGNSWALSALFQAERHDTAINDGGPMPGVFEIGSDLTLNPPSRDMNLVGYWPFDEGSGTTSTDVSGNNNTGTLTNSPTWAATSSCKVGRCLSFDGVNERINTEYDDPDFKLQTLTISTWVNPSITYDSSVANGWYDFVSKEGSSSGYKIGYNTWNGRLSFRFNVNDADKAWYNTSLSAGQWYHIVGTYKQSGGVMKLYLDGVEVASGTGVTAPAIGATTLVIGASAGFYFVNSTIDEVRIYNRALTADEIEAIYNGTK